MNLLLNLDKVNLKFFNDNDSCWFDSQIIGMNLDLIKKNYETNLKFKLQEITIKDQLRNYQNPMLNNLISMESINNSSSFLELNLQITNKNSKNYSNINMEIDVFLGNALIIYKPDTILGLLKFLKPKSESKVEIPKKKEEKNMNESEVIEIKSVYSASESTFNENKNLSLIDVILLRAKVKLEEIKLVLVHRKNHLSFSEIKVSSSKILFEQKTDEIFLDGTLGYLHVLDLTNYPRTIYKEEDWQQVF